MQDANILSAQDTGDPSRFLHQGFKALTGYDPLRWQQRLFLRLLRGDIPPVCDIPTGLGKTSAIPIWLVALASQAAQHQVTLPRRLIYIVNRRTVVDQATNVVEQARHRLLDPDNPQWAIHEKTLRSLAQLFRGLAATDEIPLAVSTLRGELADNGQWKADPARPAVIIGTIDMIGSKLLFSGYGDGRYGRVHHAGLIGQDVLVIHDEAHLTPAFSGLLRSVADTQRQTGEPRPVQVMELSATLRVGCENALQLEQQDEQDAVVRQRLDAAKKLYLQTETTGVPARLIELARKHEGAASKVLIYVRSPKDAQNIVNQLATQLKGDAHNRVALLTGTIRGYERDQLVKENPVYRAMLDHESQVSRTVYLVSTSAGEVGIDLDADHMVCDLTTLDSMIQRLGRVNRCGGPERVASVDVVVNAGEPKPKDKASDVEQAILATQVILRQWTGDSRGKLDASPGRLRMLVESLTDDQRNQAFSPKPVSLPLTDILLDAWSLTSITEPMPGRPQVAAHLHGLTTDPPETFVAWRKEVALLADAKVDDATLRDWFNACRIEARERLRDNTGQMQRTLGTLLEAHRQEDESHDFPVVLLDERGEAAWWRLSQIVERDFNLAYRTVVLPVEAGGLDAHGMLDAKTYENALDVTECGEDRRERWLLIQDANGRRWKRLVTDETGALPPQDLQEQERIALCQPPEDAEDKGESRYLLLMVPSRQSTLENPETARTMETLDNHTSQVIEQVNLIADALGLDSSLTGALAMAAQYHDGGKNRRVWQRFACNPQPDRPIAKSPKYLSGRTLCGYRHEFGSLLEATDDAKIKDHPERDLILHLIAAHHGWARPHFEPKAHDPPPTTTAKNEESGVEVLRRFGRLQQRFGRWGLAWLESLLRAADILASQNSSNHSRELKP